MKRVALALLAGVVLVVLIGCPGMVPNPFASTVTCTLSCNWEYLNGVGTDFSWRVALDDGDRVSTNSADGSSVTFRSVEHGTHTLWFTPPNSCFDEVVASYAFDVDGNTNLNIDVFDDLTILYFGSVNQLSPAAK